MTINDLVGQTILLFSVPFLVNHYLTGTAFPGRLRGMVTLGGMAWIVYSLASSPISEDILGVYRADAMYHNRVSIAIAKSLANGDWSVISEHWHTGSQAYDLGCGLLYHYAGVGMPFITTLNGWLGFLGGLILARHFGTLFSVVRIRNAGYLFIVFFPSVIYWTTSNLKEGLMYFAICLLFSGALGKRKGFFTIPFGALVGAMIGLVIRPHIIICWVGAILAVTLLRAGRRVPALALLALMPLLLNVTAAQLNIELTSESAITVAQQHFEALSGTKGGSSIEYEGGKPILFVSGFVAIFFRPFPWQAYSVRILLNSVETWTTTGLILLGWFSMTRLQRGDFLRMRETQVAAVVLVAFSLFCSFLPNVGLMTRQRVQALPALLVLAVTPFLLKQWHQKLRLALNMLHLGRFSAPQSGGGTVPEERPSPANVNPARLP